MRRILLPAGSVVWLLSVVGVAVRSQAPRIRLRTQRMMRPAAYLQEHRLAT